MKETLLTILRDKNTHIERFRWAADQIATLMAAEALQLLEEKSHRITTPLATTEGKALKESIVLLPILRAGMALLPAFLRLLPDASVGFLGIRRSEETAEPHRYYENLPQLTPHTRVIILDPMIATGGSSELTIDRLLSYRILPSQIILVGVVAASPGIERLERRFPDLKIVVAATDPTLNDQKFIVPGLGDFGDRFFGTVS